MDSYWWLVIAVAMAIIEAFSQGFITIWFVVGAIVAFAAACLGASLAVQAVVFLVVSLVCLALLRPLIMKHRKIGEAHESTPVGQNALVVEKIDASSPMGRVETSDHMTWAAISVDGNPIEEGARVRIVDQQSVKLVVERI